MKKFSKALLIILVLALIGPLLVACSGSIKLGQNWRTADRSSTGIAPKPDLNEEALVQIYAARAFNWRGIFAVHTWIATKEKNASNYRVHQVVGWRAWNSLPVVVSEEDLPDRSWYGYTPEILVDLRGADAEVAIKAIYQAVQEYNYQYRYSVWPGPNSNSFVAEIGRRVPKLSLKLPATAIGKDFLVSSVLFDKAPSATGYQFSLYGLLGITLAREEGLEVNFLGLNFGINPLKLMINLPGLGHLGLI
ncbi:MAG: DUF3750 domain-containing protein [Gammaproteobacteria bacterium]|nr:DUF3750 domain-containing protein [Gammaproteobacteria bacterium]